jgi:uncharacterized membrane protein YfcA
VTIAMLYGLCVGLVLGMTGAGGGILAVPALVLGMGWQPHAAAPVALLAVGFSAGLGAINGLRKNLVRWRAALLMAGIGVALAPLGARVAQALSPTVLMTLFAAAMFITSGRLLLRRGIRNTPADAISAAEKNCMLNPLTGRLKWTARCAATLACIGSLSGLLTGMLGVGGGFLIVPAFKQWTDLRMHGIVATSLLVIALVSMGSAASALRMGAQVAPTGFVFIAAAMAGMFVGRRVLPRLPGLVLQTGFAVLSIAVALFLLYRTWSV